MSRYILDTSVAVPLRDRDLAMSARVRGLGESVFLSVVTTVELEGGVYRDPAFALERRARLDLLLARLPVLAFADEEVVTYDRIVQRAGYSRRKLLDRMIAAQALVAGATLVTLNGDDFRDVPGLKLLEW